MDNRPLSFEEFLKRLNQTIFVSATPAGWEQEYSHGVVVEQIIRPTGLLDPQVEVRPTKTQIDDLLGECKLRMERDERVLVTTLTKRMAEDLTEYLLSMGVPARYLHSDIDTLERMAILQALRKGEFFVLVGINLLREGLDLPEVSLVCVLDADKEGFLRSGRSLIQTFGRAARNAGGIVILYADNVTDSMAKAMEETSRRREIQQAFNVLHDIIPATVRKHTQSVFSLGGQSAKGSSSRLEVNEDLATYGNPKALRKEIRKLERAMRKAAEELAFEDAARIRDKMLSLREFSLSMDA